MNTKTILTALILITILSCKEKKTLPATPAKAIPVDSANKMISSYLGSIDYQNNDTDLFSIVVDAATIRYYLDSMASGSTIRGFKFMLAHQLDYINSGYMGEPAGYRKNALTAVIAAYDEAGNYVFLAPGQVMDFNNPCPSDCPPGFAANPLIEQ